MSTNIFILKIVDLILFAQLSKGSVKISNSSQSNKTTQWNRLQKFRSYHKLEPPKKFDLPKFQTTMFEMQYITSRVHRFLHKFFYIHHDYDEYSIWNFCPMTIWKEFTSMLQSCCFCRTWLFPMVYWLVVLISLYGAGVNCYKMMKMWKDPCGKFTVWRQRHFYVMDQLVLRKVRLVSSSIYQIAWFMLVYGIIMVGTRILQLCEQMSDFSNQYFKTRIL